MAPPIEGKDTDFTDFEKIFNAFFSKITDDMYFELTEQDTKRDVGSILLDSISGFEFPRFPLYDYTVSTTTIEGIDGKPKEIIVGGKYNCPLTKEEINIFALLMLNTWVQRQLTSIENTRMKYSGSDFKMTSQANHLAKLMELKKETERQAHHYQRLYKRRKLIDDKGSIKSNWSTLMEMSALDDG